MLGLGIVAADCSQSTSCNKPDNDSQSEARILFNLPDGPDGAWRDVKILGKVAEVLAEHYSSMFCDPRAVVALLAMSRIAAEFVAAA